MGVNQLAWLLTLQPYNSTDSINLDVSDSAFESWQPGVEAWRRYVTGASSLLGNVYFQPRLSVPVLVRSYGEQDPDDNLIALLQTRDFTNAKATLSVRRLEAAPPDTVVAGRFQPLTHTTGSSRATLRARPTRSEISTTRSTSL